MRSAFLSLFSLMTSFRVKHIHLISGILCLLMLKATNLFGVPSSRKPSQSSTATTCTRKVVIRSKLCGSSSAVLMKSFRTVMQKATQSTTLKPSGPNLWLMTSPMRSCKLRQMAQTMTSRIKMVSLKVMPTLSSALPKQYLDRGSSR